VKSISTLGTHRINEVLAMSLEGVGRAI